MLAERPSHAQAVLRAQPGGVTDDEKGDAGDREHDPLDRQRQERMRAERGDAHEVERVAVVPIVPTPR